MLAFPVLLLPFELTLLLLGPVLFAVGIGIILPITGFDTVFEHVNGFIVIVRMDVLGVGKLVMRFSVR
jgi:hypothetical protein